MHATRTHIRPGQGYSIPGALPFIAGALALLVALLAPCAAGAQSDWRLQVLEAAVVQGPTVRLGEIAKPLGEMDEALWQQLAATELFPAPQKRLRPMSISGSKLASALRAYLGEQARYCILPNSIAIQRGGALLQVDELETMIVNALTPMAQKLNGEPKFRDYRLPDSIFLRDPTHEIRVELASGDIQPGRVSLRFREVAMDGSVQRTLTGSVHVDLWVQVPVAARPLNRGDEVSSQTVRYEHKNMAYLRSDIWDGSGGPWRIKGAVGKDQVIYLSNLDALPLVTKGDMVRLVYRGTNVRLEVPAEAMGDGAVNDSIPVRNMQSDRQVWAKVVDGETVQVF